MEKHLKSLTISPEFEVGIKWHEIADLAIESTEGSDKQKPIKHTLDSPIKPHKDLLDSMKKLRKFALELCEMSLGEKDNIGSWNVSSIALAGNVDLKQSRVVMTLSKLVKRTGKYIYFDTPQLTIYPEKDDITAFESTDKVTVIIEDIIEEVWSYTFDQKYNDDEIFQMALFPSREAVEA